MKQSGTNDQNMIQNVWHLRRQLSTEPLRESDLETGRGGASRGQPLIDFSKPGRRVVQNIMNYAKALEVIRLNSDIYVQLVRN